MRVTEKFVNETIAAIISDGNLKSDPIAYIGGDLGHGARYVFTDGTVCLGAREALAYVATLAFTVR